MLDKLRKNYVIMVINKGSGKTFIIFIIVWF